MTGFAGKESARRRTEEKSRIIIPGGERRARFRNGMRNGTVTMPPAGKAHALRGKETGTGTKNGKVTMSAGREHAQ